MLTFAGIEENPIGRPLVTVAVSLAGISREQENQIVFAWGADPTLLLSAPPFVEGAPPVNLSRDEECVVCLHLESVIRGTGDHALTVLPCQPANWGLSSQFTRALTASKSQTVSDSPVTRSTRMSPIPSFFASRNALAEKPALLMTTALSAPISLDLA